MRRLAVRPEGLHLLLRWLSQQIDGRVTVIDSSGNPREGIRELPAEIQAVAGDLVQRVTTGKARSASLEVGSDAVYASAIGTEEPLGTLIAVRRTSFPPELRAMVSEASGYLWLRWRLEGLQRRENRMELADTRSREAILHLLMTGNVDVARRITEALATSLPNVTRVYIIECPPGLRDDLARSCESVTHGRALLVRCPIYTRHLIILAPSETTEPAAVLDGALRAWVTNRPNCYIGAGHDVPLRDTASGYEQAFHALAIAKNRAARHATFSPREELAGVIGPSGHGWATTRLRPLLDHRPRRRQDPDARELLATLTAWSAFSTRASYQLKIHRNTLTSRLCLIERLLGCDVRDLRVLAELDLALRLLTHSGTPTGPGEPALEELLATPEVRRWAQARLDELDRAGPLCLETLRTWLGNNAGLPATAAALKLSVPAVRKRLHRIEQITQRSLLSAPSDRHDLQLALRIVDHRS